MNNFKQKRKFLMNQVKLYNEVKLHIPLNENFTSNLTVGMELHDIVHQNRSFGCTGRYSQEAGIQTRRKCTKSCGGWKKKIKETKNTTKLLNSTSTAVRVTVIWHMSLSLLLTMFLSLTVLITCTSFFWYS